MLPIERFIKFLYINDKLFRAHSGFILEAFDSTRSFSPLLLTGARPIKQILQNFSAVSCSTFSYFGWKLWKKKLINILYLKSWEDCWKMCMNPTCQCFRCMWPYITSRSADILSCYFCDKITIFLKYWTLETQWFFTTRFSKIRPLLFAHSLKAFIHGFIKKIIL